MISLSFSVNLVSVAISSVILASVLLDDVSIKFIEMNDTLPIASVNQLNEVARTNNFYLNSQSQLMFSNFYYVVNKNLADSLLTMFRSTYSKNANKKYTKYLSHFICGYILLIHFGHGRLQEWS